MKQTLVTKILLTWRLTSLLVSEEGPFDAFVQIRDAIGVSTDEFSQCVGENVFAKAFCCFWCASVWVGFAVAMASRENPIWGLVYSAGATLIERFFKTWLTKR